jgi:hypothetical protein
MPKTESGMQKAGSIMDACAESEFRFLFRDAGIISVGATLVVVYRCQVKGLESIPATRHEFQAANGAAFHSRLPVS